MEKPLRILFIEDSVDDVALIQNVISRGGIFFSSHIVENKEEYEIALRAFQPQVVISDHTLPQFNSLEALEIYKQYKGRQPFCSVFILVTGTVSEEFAVEIIKKGADDYLLKDRLKRLPSAITTALEKSNLEAQRIKIEEEKLQLLNVLQKSLHEIYLFSPETHLFDYANEEALRNTGYAIEEMVNLSLLELMEEINPKSLQALLACVIKSEKGQIFETYFQRKNKSRYPVQVHLQLVEQGHRKTYLANVLDRTEIKKHELQKDLALIIQKTFNRNNTLEESFTSILSEFCKRFDTVSAAEVWSKNFKEANARRIAHYGLSLNSTSEAEIELGKEISSAIDNIQEDYIYHSKKSNKGDVLSAVGCPILLGQEVLAVFVFYSRELITDTKSLILLEKNVRDQLANNIKRKKSEEELSRIFELSPDALVVAGLDGYIKKVNPVFTDILGYSHSEILSTPYKEFVHPDDWGNVLNWERDFKEGKNPITYCENRYRTRSGEYVWFAWSVTSFLEEELCFAVGKNITQQKQQLIAIAHQNERLAEIAWEQSHVVRGPLTRIMGCIQYLEENEDSRAELLNNIKISAFELDDIIKEIVKKAESIKACQ